MKTEQLAELFRNGFTGHRDGHDQATIDKFLFIYKRLWKWNTKTNLTGHKNEQEMIGNLFIDSLACTRVFSPDTAYSILDIGTGAGFPGIPIGIVSPQQDVTLLEPNLKKVRVSASYYRFPWLEKTFAWNRVGSNSFQRNREFS